MKITNDHDDKNLIIAAVMLICVAAMAIPNVPTEAFVLAEKAFYGLFGVAVGKSYNPNIGG